jgi:hypothetical protein
VQRDTKEVLAELVQKLKEKLGRKKVAARGAGEKHPSGELRPNLDRLTVGVDLGDQRSHYCILGLEGETLAEGQLRTTQEDWPPFSKGLNGPSSSFRFGHRTFWMCFNQALFDCWDCLPGTSPTPPASLQHRERFPRKLPGGNLKTSCPQERFT